jgi:diguanylate cyclase (GGDEF)-like protein
VGRRRFLIISPETKQEEARHFAERLRKEIDLISMGNNIRVTASFGVAQLQENDFLKDLVLRADGRLYEAKSKGRNRVA